MLGDKDCETEGLKLTETDGDTDGESDSLTLGETDGDNDSETDGESEGESDGLNETEDDGEIGNSTITLKKSVRGHGWMLELEETYFTEPELEIILKEIKKLNKGGN